MSDPAQPAAPESAAAPPAPAPAAAPAAPAPSPLAQHVASKPAAEAAPAPPPPAAEAPAAKTVISPLARLSAKQVAAAQQRTDALVTENAALKAQAEKAAALEAVVAAHAATELAGLPSDAHRAAILEMAGEDAAAQLRAISALKKHNVVAAALPVGATTTPPPAPAPGAASDADASAAATYDRLARQAPLAAAQYLLTNRDAIERGRAKAAAPRN